MLQTINNPTEERANLGPLEIEKHETLSGELKPNMKRVLFPKGKKRYIHVNRHAIAANLQDGETFPTVIVVDENKEIHQFHAALFSAGVLKFDTVEGVEAKVFVVTTEKIIGFTDPYSQVSFVPPVEEPVDWFKPFKWLGNMLMAPLRAFGWGVKKVGQAPVFACLTFHAFDD